MVPIVKYTTKKIKGTLTITGFFLLLIFIEYLVIKPTFHYDMYFTKTIVFHQLGICLNKKIFYVHFYYTFLRRTLDNQGHLPASLLVSRLLNLVVCPYDRPSALNTGTVLTFLYSVLLRVVG